MQMNAQIRSTFIDPRSNRQLHLYWKTSETSAATKAIDTESNKRKFKSDLKIGLMLDLNKPHLVHLINEPHYDVLGINRSIYWQNRLERIVLENENEVEEVEVENLRYAVDQFLDGVKSEITSANAIVKIRYLANRRWDEPYEYIDEWHVDWDKNNIFSNT